MKPYGDFAYVYDELMSDVPYEAWVRFYLSQFEKYHARPTLLLDAGCGTGTVSCLLSGEGIEVIGCDPSEDMLSVANEKAEGIDPRPIFICQSMQELDLYGTVNGAVSTLDCINYLPDRKSLVAALSRVSLFLEPGALFIFDVNTPEKLRKLDGRAVVKESEDVYCVWQSRWMESRRKCRFEIDLFLRGEDRWFRTFEAQSETAFSLRTLRRAIADAGLELLSIEPPTQEMPETAEERLFFVTRKPSA